MDGKRKLYRKVVGPMADDKTMKVAEALYALDPDRQPWDGDPFGFQEAIRRGEYRVKKAIKQAEMLSDLGFLDFEVLEHAQVSMWEIGRAYGVR